MSRRRFRVVSRDAGGREGGCADGQGGCAGECDGGRAGGAGPGGPRVYSRGWLGPGHPCGYDAALLVSELFGNSVRHSGSGAKGETVTVAVRGAGGVVRVEVTDRGGRGVPQLRACGGEAEGGRSLRQVAGLATSWGWRRRGGRTVTWF